jgi:hypothetical protein
LRHHGGVESNHRAGRQAEAIDIDDFLLFGDP